jgi:hypothetical protein
MKNSCNHSRSQRPPLRSIQPTLWSLTTTTIPSLNRVQLIYVSKSFVILNLLFESFAFHLKDSNIRILSFVGAV